MVKRKINLGKIKRIFIEIYFFYANAFEDQGTLHEKCRHPLIDLDEESRKNVITCPF